MIRALLVFAGAVLAAVAAPAQETTALRAKVASASVRSVYLDAGRDDGVRAGDRVRLFPAGSAPVEGVVQAVTAHNARVDLTPGLPVPQVGTGAEIEIVAGRSREPEAPSPRRAEGAPEHPPWTRGLEPRDPDQPLLAPAYGRRPEDRPVTAGGRVWSHLLHTEDRGAGRDRSWTLARLGTDLRVTNALGLAGRFELAGSLDHRGIDLLDEPGGDDTRTVLDRVSYTVGGEEYAPFRAEVGRFRPHVAPELGLLDGVEGALQLEGGWRVGAGFGALPLPFPSRASGEDVGAHLFADYLADDEGSFHGVLAVQKTWHEGTQDRDRGLVRVQGRLGGAWTYSGAATVDLYRGDDAIKGPGPELTEGWARVGCGTAGGGGSLSLSHYRWPELKRREFRFLPADLVADGRVDRASVSGWYRLLPEVTGRLRLDAWQDQDDDGGGGEVAADWSDVLGSGAALHLAAFRSDGAFLSGPGLRAVVRGGGTPGWHLGYDHARYERAGLLTGSETLTRQSVHGGADWYTGGGTVSLTARHDFGDGEDALFLGLYLQTSF